MISEQLPRLAERYPKLLMNDGIAGAISRPPSNPDDCVFSKMSANYSADLRSRVEPCVFGGVPDCSQCGCAISSGLHWIRGIRLAGPLKIDHFIGSSIQIGRFVNRLRQHSDTPRWDSGLPQPKSSEELVQIGR